MNSVNMTGRWVADLTERAVGEKKKAEGRIAVKVSKDVSHFFDVTLWEKTADIGLQYCKKGDVAIISGRLCQDTWEKDGEKRSKVYITVERLDLPPKASAGDQESTSSASSSSASSTSTKPTGSGKAASSRPAPAKETEPDDFF